MSKRLRLFAVSCLVAGATGTILAGNENFEPLTREQLMVFRFAMAGASEYQRESAAELVEPAIPFSRPDKKFGYFPLTMGLAARFLMLSDRLSVGVAGALLAVGTGSLWHTPSWFWAIVFASACAGLFILWCIGLVQSRRADEWATVSRHPIGPVHPIRAKIVCDAMTRVYRISKEPNIGDILDSVEALQALLRTRPIRPVAVPRDRPSRNRAGFESATHLRRPVHESLRPGAHLQRSRWIRPRRTAAALRIISRMNAALAPSVRRTKVSQFTLPSVNLSEYSSNRRSRHRASGSGISIA